MNFEDIIANKPDHIKAMMHQLRVLSLKIHEEIQEDCYGGKVVQMALYSIGRKDNPTHGISASDDHCKVFFHHFDKIDLLRYKLVGKGKHSRHLKLFKKEEIDEQILLKILKNIGKITAAKK